MEPVEAWKQQVEDDQLVRAVEREAEPDGAVAGGVDHEPFSLEPQAEKLEDP